MNSVYCRQCKAEIDPSHQFCPKCGTDQTTGTKPLVQQQPPQVIMKPPKSSAPAILTIIGLLIVIAGGSVAVVYMNELGKKNTHSPTKSTPPQRPPVQTAQNSAVPPQQYSSQNSTSARGAVPTANTPTQSQPGIPASSGIVAPSANNQTASPLPPEPGRAPVQMQGRAHIGNAHIGVENDGHGNEQATGRVLIVNDGPYAITDFRLGLKVLTTEYALVPFEGSLQYPTPILSRRIEPGGSLEVPVMTTGVYMSYSTYNSKEVTLQATIDGPPGTLTDAVSVQ